MAFYRYNSISKPRQFLISVLLIGFVSSVCFIVSEFIDYKVVALILLVTVSFIAMFFDILPVLVAAVLSALAWDFLFIPPRFTFTISSAEDTLMLVMYFLIALLNGVLTFKIRQVEKQVRMKEEKEKAIKLYNVFLNSLSHELRTPIATIIGASDNLELNSDKLTNENRNLLVKEISRASLRLNRQVENLLNISRLESGFLKLKKDWCDLSELIYSVTTSLEDELSKHELVINIEENIPLFKLDRVLIEQVINNILTNSALYTPIKSTIMITAQAKPNRLILQIEDNGTGFDPEEISLVFDKFYRPKEAKSGGTGLGLSIVKGFVEAHNGTVALFNLNSGGARFIIDIPCETTSIKNSLHE